MIQADFLRDRACRVVRIARFENERRKHRSGRVKRGVDDDTRLDFIANVQQPLGAGDELIDAVGGVLIGQIAPQVQVDDSRDALIRVEFYTVTVAFQGGIG